MTYKDLEALYESIEVERAYNADEVCQLLGVSMTSIQRWARSGNLKRYRNRMGMTFYMGVDVKAFCKEHMLDIYDKEESIVEPLTA